MLNWKMMLISIICLLVFTIVITYDLAKNEKVPILTTHQENKTIIMQSKIMSITNQVVTNETSTVLNTQQIKNYTVFDLTNGIKLNDTDNNIKAGDKVKVQVITGLPVCGFQFKFENETTVNNIPDILASNQYRFVKDMQGCHDDLKILYILKWNKIVD